MAEYGFPPWLQEEEFKPPQKKISWTEYQGLPFGIRHETTDRFWLASVDKTLTKKDPEEKEYCGLVETHKNIIVMLDKQPCSCCGEIPSDKGKIRREIMEAAEIINRSAVHHSHPPFGPVINREWASVWERCITKALVDENKKCP